MNEDDYRASTITRLHSKYAQALHLIDELVTALEIERQDHEVDRVELGYWRQLAQQQAAS